MPVLSLVSSFYLLADFCETQKSLPNKGRPHPVYGRAALRLGKLTFEDVHELDRGESPSLEAPG